VDHKETNALLEELTSKNYYPELMEKLGDGFQAEIGSVRQLNSLLLNSGVIR